MRINKKKLENATSQNQIDSLKLAIESNERSIAASVTNAYNNVISARDIYNYAKADMDLQKDNMIVAEKQYAIGSISKVEYETQQVATDTAICTYEQAKLSLLSAINSYNWSMMGLASAS